MKVTKKLTLAGVVGILLAAVFVSVALGVINDSGLQITKPTPTGTVTNALPELAAYVTHAAPLASASFTVDATTTLTGKIDTNFDRVSVKLSSKLSQGSHTVSLTVTDTAGNQATNQWQFNLDTNVGATSPTMTVSTNATCWSCHTKEYNYGHVAPEQCLECHSTKFTSMTQFRNCIGCHYGRTYITGQHYTTETWVWSNLPNDRHPLSDEHLSSTTSSDCTKCHSRILTVTHYQKKDSNGSSMTCDTCHTNTYLATVSSDEAIRVKNAVSNQQTNCDSCHKTVPDHQVVHDSSFDSKCTSSGCHSANLMTEHLNNATTAGKGYTCDTCHASARSEVSMAISSQQLVCSSCHATAHNVPLSFSVPADIPLYAGLTFSKPMQAALFSGDDGLPAGYETSYKSGLVVVSNRTGLHVSDVWNFYSTGLTGQGWTLKSAVPDPSTGYFAAEFAKGGRLVTVRCYDTANGDNSGPVLSGYRVDIWYR